MNPIFGDGGCNLDYIMFLPEAELPRRLSEASATAMYWMMRSA
jgi:hypothetical protein